MRKIAYIISSLLFTLTSLAMAESFKLDVKGNAPVYLSKIPAEVYQYSHSDDLQDLTITNADGEQVPYALLPYHELNQVSISKQDIKPLTFYPIKEDSLNNPDNLQIQLEKDSGNTSVNISSSKTISTEKTVYLIDIGKKHPPLQTLSLDWNGDKNKFFDVEVSASNDLKNWTVIGSGSLIKAAVNDKFLEGNTISLNQATEVRYLQIREVGAEPSSPLSLTKISAVYNAVSPIQGEYFFKTLTFLQREQDDKKGLVNVDFESQGHYPAFDIRVQLPQSNAITNVSIFSRNKNDEPWQFLATSKLSFKNEGRMPNSDQVGLMAPAAHYWRLQFDQANGGLGKENPILSLGWMPKTIVWNARGTAPFTLQVGESPKIVNTLAVTNLISEYSPEKARQLPTAAILVSTPKPNEAVTNQATTGAKETENTWTSPPDYKTWLLWGGLLLGVLLLASMAYSLVKTDSKE
jgi:hypothetical protein